MEEPRYYFFAPLDAGLGGPIALGNIIETPRFADSPINEVPVPLADDKIIKPAARTDYHLKTGKTTGGSVGLFADFLSPILGVGGNTSVDLKPTKEQDITCDLLETRWFRPSPDYIKKSIDDPDVRNYILQNRGWISGNSKLFMITGIKIAHHAKFAYKIIKEKGVSFHFGLDGTNSGVPVKIGPDVDLRKDDLREESFTIVEPFIMAYRINAIKIKAKTGDISSNQPYTEGAALEPLPVSGNEDIELFASLEERDASAADVGLEGHWAEWEADEGKIQHFGPSSGKA